MFTLLPLLAAAAIVLTMFAIVAAHANSLHPATVDPFAPAAPTADPAADTIAGESLVRTALAPPNVPSVATGWQSVTLASLSAVEDLLDALEAHGVRDREVVAVTDDEFAVRWK